MAECEECGEPKKPYPPGTGPFVRFSSVQMGQKFRIPDWHGGYGMCCKRPAPAIYELVADDRDICGRGHRCTSCGEQAPNDCTTIREVEIVT